MDDLHVIRTLPGRAAVLALAVGGHTLGAQAPNSDGGRVEVEAHVGQSVAVRSPVLSDADVALAARVGVRVRPGVRLWGALDLRPGSASPDFRFPAGAPALPSESAPRVSLQALTAGISMPGTVPVFALPFEVGVGLGATRVALEPRGSGTAWPAGATLAEVRRSGLLGSSDWHPTAAARLRVDVPLGRVLRLQAAGALLATRVGDVRLWNGAWEDADGGTVGGDHSVAARQAPARPGVRTWALGTVYTVPITVGLGLRF